jgi:hypothetical protein
VQARPVVSAGRAQGSCAAPSPRRHPVLASLATSLAGSTKGAIGNRQCKLSHDGTIDKITSRPTVIVLLHQHDHLVFLQTQLAFLPVEVVQGFEQRLVWLCRRRRWAGGGGGGAVGALLTALGARGALLTALALGAGADLPGKACTVGFGLATGLATGLGFCSRQSSVSVGERKSAGTKTTTKGRDDVRWRARTRMTAHRAAGASPWG